jgi:hypothetical protein
MVKPIKRGRGRPPTGGRDPLRGIRMPPELWSKVESWAGEQDDLPTMSEAVRRLVEHGLAWSKGLETSSQPTRTGAKGKEFAAAAAEKRIDKAQAHEKPGTGRGKRKAALTEFPTELLEKPASRKRPGK